MPEMTVWSGLLVGAHLEGRVLLGQREEGLAHLVLVDLGLRLDRDVDHRLGELEVLEHDLGCPGAESVSPVRVFLRPMPAAMSPVNTASTSSRWLACICRMRPMRSLLASWWC